MATLRLIIDHKKDGGCLVLSQVDISKVPADAIVNAVNSSLMGGDGIERLSRLDPLYRLERVTT